MDSDAPTSGCDSVMSIINLSDISDDIHVFYCRCHEVVGASQSVGDCLEVMQPFPSFVPTSPPYEPTSPPYKPYSPPYEPTSPPVRVVLALRAVPSAMRVLAIHRRFLGQTPRQRRAARVYDHLRRRRFS